MTTKFELEVARRERELAQASRQRDPAVARRRRRRPSRPRSGRKPHAWPPLQDRSRQGPGQPRGIRSHRAGARGRPPGAPVPRRRRADPRPVSGTDRRGAASSSPTPLETLPRGAGVPAGTRRRRRGPPRSGRADRRRRRDPIRHPARRAAAPLAQPQGGRLRAGSELPLRGAPISQLLVLRDTAANRRLVETFRQTFATAYPADPVAAIAALTRATTRGPAQP